jgi:sulfate permease, SulP family
LDGDAMTGIRRIAPIFGWLPHYDRRWLLADTIAGLTVWALVVPEAMAYAGIAGVPVQYGLYTVPLALAGYIVFGSSRRLFVGPSATVATISATAVATVAVANAPQAEFVALTASLALLVGAIYIVLGLFRMGFIARFFARPVLAGFIIGLGIFIAVGQVPKLVGIDKPAGDTVAVFVSTLAHVADWQWTTVAVGVAALVALFALSRFAPKAPGALAVVVLAMIAAKIFDLGSHGVALVGDVPTGFSFTSWSGVSAATSSTCSPALLRS